MLRWVRQGILGVVLAWPMAVHARDVVSPSALTPQNIRPTETRRDSEVRLPSALPPSTKPSAPSNLDVLITSVALDGAFPEMAASNARARGLTGQRLSVSEIYDFAKSLEDDYVRAGFIFVRVTVPPQNLRDNGQVLFVIIDGFIESIDVSGVPPRARKPIVERVRPLIGQRHLRRQEVERRLLLAGDVPGVSLRSTLARGEREGGVRLVLEADHRPVTGSVGVDNRNPTSLGTWQLRGAVAFNSLTGRGEQVYGTVGIGSNVASAFDGTSRLTLYGVGVVMPIGSEGLTLNPEYTSSKTATPATIGAPATIGDFDRIALRLRAPYIRTKQDSLYFNISGELLEQKIRAPDFNLQLSQDRYGALRIGPDYERAFENGSVFRGSLSYSQGLGGRTESDAIATAVPVSRWGASPTFSKLNFNARYSLPLPAKFRADAIGAGQWAMSKPMFRSEQFGLDGSDGVSAYVPGTFNTDTGFVLRGELSRPFDFPVKSLSGVRPGLATPYLFAASGKGWLHRATVVEQSQFQASAVGAGIRVAVDSSLREPGMSLGFEYAKQFTNVPTQPEGWRANVTATVVY